MKKILIGLASCAALVPAPAFAGATSNSAWDVINETTSTAKQLVLVGGLADEFDACGNSKPFFSFLIPIDEVLDTYLDDNELTIAEVAATPGFATSFWNDHIVRGSVSPDQLVNSSVTTLLSVSGFRITKTVTDQVDPQVVEGEVYLSGRQIISSEPVCNGVIYWLGGVIDTDPQAVTEGANNVPAVTTAPATESGLPDTL